MLLVDCRGRYSPLKDIDIDLAPSKRPLIFKKIREERGELGLVQVCTFGTEGTKSAILTACRGYRGKGSGYTVTDTTWGAEEPTSYMEGIEPDIAHYMSSLIPQERGFLWPIHDVVYGNPEKGRKPVQEFIREVNKYPRLLDIIISIEGMVNKRSSHASGVILYDEDPYKTAAFMRSKSGDLITQYNLHNAESAGDTKYDFLVTEVSDKIITCIDLLQKDNILPADSTLRNVYNNYLHPEILDTNNPKIWEHLAKGDILDVFQFNEGSGLAIAKKLRPTNPLEMTSANAMMRLMSERGKESQQDRYYRIQHQGLQVFDQEMVQHHLPENMRETMHRHCDKYFGCCPIQEQMMQILMDIVGFSLGEANAARKIVAKKKMNEIPVLKEKVYQKLNNREIADYIWEVAIAPQLGYAFSLNHSLPYSFVGMQTIYLAITFNVIYWNTACLIVNSGATDRDNAGQTDYSKIAKAIGEIRNKGIHVSLIDINKSSFGFAPDVKNNQILFGFKGMLNVGDGLIEEIIAKRPYSSMWDFLNRVAPNKQAAIALIKSGAFDNFGPRKTLMGQYIWMTCDKKKRLTLQNLPTLFKYDLVPHEGFEVEKAVYFFNKLLKKTQRNAAGFYVFNESELDFLNYISADSLINTSFQINAKDWEKFYQKNMDSFRKWLSESSNQILQKLNGMIFLESWNKYAKGNISAWEMETMCFYYHDHELKNLNTLKYGVSDFFELPEEPVVWKTFKRNGLNLPIYELNRICGTCIAKDKTKSIVYLLTTTGVVPVKFRREYFSLFDKQVSQIQPDGTKKIMEKSWFNRGSMIIVQGIRRGDNFIPKKYSNSALHQLYHIDSIDEQGNLSLRHERIQGNSEEE